jgi:general secretion pathway protein D
MMAGLCSAVLCGPVCGQSSGSDLVQAELQRRAAAVDEARVLLEKGDEAYEGGRYAEAVEAYRGAVDLIPANAPVLAEQRAAAVERLAQASVERSKELRRAGDLGKAEEVIEAVLAENVAPDHPAALMEQEHLLDPHRTNPASTPELTRDIDQVRQLLYKAQGAYDLGNFDEAHGRYEEVLRIDATNAAARRGMERVAAARSSYARAAYDQTRNEMLSQVDEAWEIQVPPTLDAVSPDGGNVRMQPQADYLDKVVSMTIPAMVLDDVNIVEALDFLRAQAIDLDSLELDPARKGVNIVLDIGGPDSDIGKKIRAIRFNINLRNIPFDQALNYVCEQTGTRRVDQPFAISIRPAGGEGEDLIARTYNVPPDFLTSGGDAAGDAGGAVDPFSDAPAEGGLLSTRLTAEEVLKSKGVSFPEGSAATFNPGNSTLRVLNTADNQSIVEQIVEALAQSEPTSVIVNVKILKTTQENLEELGFDWLLGDFGLGGTGGVPGRDAGYLTGGTQGNGGDLSDVATADLFRRGITAGNRSGEEAILGNSIDSVLGNNDRGFGNIPARAPGALWVNGVLNNTNVTMLMRGISQKKGTDVAAVPSVTTRSGQAASVRVIRELIYPTEYEPPELPNTVGGDVLIDLDTGEAILPEAAPSPVTPATPTGFEMREVGIVLEVLPTASADKRFVDISLKPEMTDFDGFINYGSPILAGQQVGIGFGPGGIFADPTDIVITPNEILMPVFSKIGTETALTVADNATIVLGGLLEERIQNVEDKTPVLGDLPMVGRLFQSKAYSPVKTAIVIMVHVRVVDAAGRPFHP